MRQQGRRPCDECSAPPPQGVARCARLPRGRGLRHPPGLPHAGGSASVPAGALARAHDDLRRASAPGPLGAARVAAHDGRRGMRIDAFPEQGPPGSDLALMRAQHLDANGVEYGMLMQLSRGGMEERNLDFAAALSRAVNDWQLEAWVKPEPR